MKSYMITKTYCLKNDRFAYVRTIINNACGIYVKQWIYKENSMRERTYRRGNKYELDTSISNY